MKTCMKCGGMKKAKVGAIVEDPSKKEIRKSMRAIKKMDREDKRYIKKLEKQEKKTMKKGGITQNIVGMPGYNATLYPTSFKKGGTKNAKLAAVAPPKDKITRRDVLTKILRKKK